MGKFKSDDDKFQKILRSGKAYDDPEFIHSPDARTIRILTEYLYPEQYFRKYGVKKTILFFGSARSVPMKRLEEDLKILNERYFNSDAEDKEKLKNRIEYFEKQRPISKLYDEAVELAKKVGDWSMSLPKWERYYICTGGGPGMMEAANKGALHANSESIGLNISLPFEQEPNQFITPELNFEFHYFFMRKFWFIYHAKAIVALPGGFGTLDEVMEILTLKQTQKVTKPLTILFYGEEFWKRVIDFDYWIEMGMISPEDMELFKFVNSPDEAFEKIVKDMETLDLNTK